MRATHDAASPAGQSSDEDFLARFGDVIDDRVAEALGELLEERAAALRCRRLRQALGTVAVVLALAAAAVCCLTATWIAAGP